MPWPEQDPRRAESGTSSRACSTPASAGKYFSPICTRIWWKSSRASPNPSAPLVRRRSANWSSSAEIHCRRVATWALPLIQLVGSYIFPCKKGSPQRSPHVSRVLPPDRGHCRGVLAVARDPKGTHMKTELMLCLAGMLFFASAVPAGQIEHAIGSLPDLARQPDHLSRGCVVYPRYQRIPYFGRRHSLGRGGRDGIGELAPLIRRRGPYHRRRAAPKSTRWC